MAANEYMVSGMTCGHCEVSIREEIAAVPGIEDIQVSAQSGTLIITGADDINDEKVLAAVK